MNLPLRSADLDIADFDDEFVVFDPRCSEVHLLRSTTAVVFDACDGASTVEALVGEFVELTGLDQDAARELISEAVREFDRRGLLVGTKPEERPP